MYVVNVKMILLFRKQMCLLWKLEISLQHTAQLNCRFICASFIFLACSLSFSLFLSTYSQFIAFNVLKQRADFSFARYVERCFDWHELRMHQIIHVISVGLLGNRTVASSSLLLYLYESAFYLSGCAERANFIYDTVNRERDMLKRLEWFGWVWL